MALDLHWYDISCFVMVAVAVAGSLWVILTNEGSRRPDDWTQYDYWSLLIVAEEQAGEPKLVALARIGHVGSGQLWMSCWRCVHPGWLLALRMLSLFVLIGVLMWIMWSYGSSILLYYTEYVITAFYHIFVAREISIY